MNYELIISKKKQINLYSSNKKLLKFFPKLQFMSFKDGLIKTLKENLILWIYSLSFSTQKFKLNCPTCLKK